MRDVNAIIAERLASRQQTSANNSNPAAYLRIMRHHIPLSQRQFLERTIIKKTADITDSDVAVCHPGLFKTDEDIWVAYIADSTLHIRYTKNREVLTDSYWHDYSLEVPATACSIAFNSIARHNVQGIWEFVTEKKPWAFWVDEGQLKAKKCTPLGGTIYELALANVTDVSAVRGPSGEYGNWDLGLTVFFVMGGSLYYRQLINGTWYDAELIQISGLSSITISKIKAFNTWDHRVGVQILASDGKLYELFSYTEGIGTRGTENLSIEITGIGNLQKIERWKGYESEHLSISIAGYGRRRNGLSTEPVSASNSNSTTISVTMDDTNTGGQASEFYLRDSNGIVYACTAVSCSGSVITLTCLDFNRAAGATITVVYTQGTLMSPSVLTESFEITFTPTGLTLPSVAIPTIDEIYNE